MVLGGRSGGSRDAIMRNLLAENLEKGATTRTVVAITERNGADANTDLVQADTGSRPIRTVQAIAAAPEPAMAAQASRLAPAKPSRWRRPPAALPAPARQRFGRQAKPEPAPLTNGVIQTPADLSDPGLVRADEAGPGQDGSGQGRHR